MPMTLPEAISILSARGGSDLGPQVAEAKDVLLAGVERVLERLPCGHRKVDHDDSYGGCALCGLKQCHEADERALMRLESWIAENEDQWVMRKDVRSVLAEAEALAAEGPQPTGASMSKG